MGLCSLGNKLICAHWSTFNEVRCCILVTEDCVVPPKNEVNVPVKMLEDGIPILLMIGLSSPADWNLE